MAPSIRTEAEFLVWRDAQTEEVQAAVGVVAAYFARMQISTAVALLRNNRDDQVQALLALLDMQQTLLEASRGTG